MSGNGVWGQISDCLRKDNGCSVGGFCIGTGQPSTLNGGKEALSMAGNKGCLSLSRSEPSNSCFKCERRVSLDCRTQKACCISSSVSCLVQRCSSFSPKFSIFLFLLKIRGFCTWIAVMALGFFIVFNLPRADLLSS